MTDETKSTQDRLVHAYEEMLKRSVQLQNWARQARQAVGYHAGEITGPGTLVCAACGAEVHMHQPGHIPPCPKCHGIQFKRPAPSSEDAS